MNNKSGLYFHIPFCKSKCPYCDFYSVKYDCAAAEVYVDLLLKEMKKYDGTFDTVYFGGGTPSIIKPELIGRLLDGARRQFDIDNDSEITIECNPSGDLKEAFIKYRNYGINRISIGMQSAVDSERFALARSAGKAQVLQTVNNAKNAGFDNISLDIMLGIPKQTLDSLDETFDFVDKAGVQHISAYMLKIEQGTKFFEMRDRLLLPDEDSVSEMYLKTVNTLDELGFAQYEISNFAKKDFQSRHNNKYWQLDDYLGIGKSAHSLWKGRRFYYDENMSLVDDGAGGGEEEEIMLGLRLAQGIKSCKIRKPYNHFVEMGLMKTEGERISLTPEGMLVSNAIISELI